MDYKALLDAVRYVKRRGGEIPAEIAEYIKANVRIIPRGANEPRVPIAGEIEIDEEDAAAAARDWDRVMPEEFRGMLDAEVVNRQTRPEA